MDKLFSFYSPGPDYIENRQIVLEYYETYFGIYDFTKPGSGLASVAMHPKEEYFKNSIYDNRLRKYLELDVAKKLNMSFDEYLNRPRYEIENIDRVLGEFLTKVNKLEEKTQDDLKKEQERDQRKAAKETTFKLK